MTSKAGAQRSNKPCNINGPYCPGMQIAIEASSSLKRPKGLCLETMFSLQGPSRQELVLHLPKKVNGASYILINYCPFCGKPVRK